ncbi:MAG: FeoA domain-containing protein [Thermoanaerobaculia bacterium]
MINPYLALLWVIGLTLTAIYLLRPDRGLLWRLLRASKATERVLVEDALKHLFDCEYRQQVGTLQSLSGVLTISGNRAAELLESLEVQGLISSGEGGYLLTREGRRHALQVIRIHRLWERYFSDETGLEPRAWHQEAELREHTTTPAEAEALAAKMGNPPFDPHGDPIPTASGEMPPPQGSPLTELPVGELAEIVHIEDEPEAVYAQLLAEGLHPGMRVRVNESTPRRIRFEANAEEIVLAPVLAANLSVAPLPEEVEMPGPFERLSELPLGRQARVVAIAPTLRAPERRRMLDLGLVPGTVVEAELRSPSGDPTGYRIRGAVIALRQDQADQIQIERLEASAAS